MYSSCLGTVLVLVDALLAAGREEQPFASEQLTNSSFPSPCGNRPTVTPLAADRGKSNIKSGRRTSESPQLSVWPAVPPITSHYFPLYRFSLAFPRGGNRVWNNKAKNMVLGAGSVKMVSPRECLSVEYYRLKRIILFSFDGRVCALELVMFFSRISVFALIRFGL